MFPKTKAMIAGLVFVGVLLSGCTSSSTTNTAGPDQEVIKQLHAAYTDYPYKGGQATPDHEWSCIDASCDHIQFLHWMPKTTAGVETGGDPSKADQLFAIGDGFLVQKACLGSAGITQQQIDAGYVHFHKQTAAEWNAGHGWKNADGSTFTGPGYWLRHVAAISGVTMMGPGPSTAGKTYKLMDTSAGLPAC